MAATNLSGASSANGTVTHVTGSWIVPTLLPTTDDTYCAIWVGIDGYASNTVEQIGTSHNWLNGSQQNYAWFEMYPKGAYEIIGFPVDNGDTIRARVHYKGNNTFRLVIYNETQSVFTVIPKSYTMSTKAKRSCAEWIVEAPYLGGILPLSDFQSVTFQRCATIINGIKGPINSTSWVNDEITMEDSGGLEAQPSDLLENGSYFRVVWQSE